MYNSTGLLTCSRYAYAPNHFHYCGPEKQKDLLAYVQTKRSDQGLTNILHHFETLYPYLVLIASQNNIKDPFDPRVVEAYWLGNPLLKNVKMRAFGDHLADTLQLKKKVKKNDFSPMMERMITGVPQHNFHVMNIFIRTGYAALVHTLSTMDQCRISWGKVIANLTNPTNLTNNGKRYMVLTQPLVYTNNRLTLSQPEQKHVTCVSFMPKIGDWVSIHWGFVCDVLGVREVALLKRYTMLALHHANTGKI